MTEYQIGWLVNSPGREKRIRELVKENEKFAEALREIASRSVHSEPLGAAMGMQDIAREALKNL